MGLKTMPSPTLVDQIHGSNTNLPILRSKCCCLLYMPNTLRSSKADTRPLGRGLCLRSFSATFVDFNGVLVQALIPLDDTAD